MWKLENTKNEVGRGGYHQPRNHTIKKSPELIFQYVSLFDLSSFYSFFKNMDECSIDTLWKLILSLPKMLWSSLLIIFIYLSLYGCSKGYLTNSLLLNIYHFQFLTVVNNYNVNMFLDAFLSDYFLRINSLNCCKLLDQRECTFLRVYMPR